MLLPEYQGRDEGEASEVLSLGAKFKGAPENPGIKINNTLLQYSKKSKGMQKYP